MNRITLEKMWLDFFDFNNTDDYEMKVKMLSAQPSEKLAGQIIQANEDMLRTEGIRWLMSSDVEMLEDVEKNGCSEEDKHITVKEWKDYHNFIDEYIQDNEEKEM